MDILGLATKISAGKHHSVKNDDVFIDRLNHRYTVTMLLVFAGIVTTQQYFGSPISCWVTFSDKLIVFILFLICRFPLNLQVVMKNMLMIYVG